MPLGAEREVGEVVVGLPRNMDGSLGPQAEAVEAFVEQLEAVLPGPVQTWDERLSSLEAGSRHKRADADQLGFKGEVDPYGLLNPGKMESFVPAQAK